jgi:hypothetical protein
LAATVTDAGTLTPVAAVETVTATSTSVTALSDTVQVDDAPAVRLAGVQLTVFRYGGASVRFLTSDWVFSVAVTVAI